MNGGSETMRYFVSLSSRSQQGYYYNSGTKYNQYDLRANLDANVNKYITLSLDVAGRLEDRNYPTRSAGSIFRMVMRGKPNEIAYWPNGMPGPDIEYGDNPVVVSTKPLKKGGKLIKSPKRGHSFTTLRLRLKDCRYLLMYSEGDILNNLVNCSLKYFTSANPTWNAASFTWRSSRNISTAALRSLIDLMKLFTL